MTKYRIVEFIAAFLGVGFGFMTDMIGLTWAAVGAIVCFLVAFITLIVQIWANRKQ